MIPGNLLLWYHRGGTSPEAHGPGSDFARVLGLLVLGGLFLIAGLWTLGQTRSAMAQLADSITRWHASAASTPTPATA